MRDHRQVGSGRVLGVDACRPGWIGITLGDDGTSAHFAPGIQALVELAAAAGPLAAVAIDIPIGLAAAGRRQADELARRALGPPWPSIFITPCRATLLAADYGAAVAENRRLAGEGISRQAFALRAKILDVDGWVRSTPLRVAEAHPELSFAGLAGTPLRSRKSTWAGVAERRALLARAGIVLADDLGPPAEQAGVDDVLDAAVMAWTAQRVASGSARPLPDPPELLSDGSACAIWT
jgi:predicted RNase H-like nuclease